MKEFSSQTGGRFTYVDDVLNLQELALAFSAIFDECDNFIVSGCEVSDTSIAPGVVYLNGKLRVFNGASNIASWPQYIYEVNTTESVPYQAGGEKIGRNVWGCASSSKVPSAITPLTGKTPIAITVTKDGGPLMKDVWIGKYAVLLDPTYPNQVIKGQLSVNNLKVLNQLDSAGGLRITNGNSSSWIYQQGENLVIESTSADGVKFTLKANQTANAFHFYRNNIVLASIGADRIIFNRPVGITQLYAGNLAISDSDIYNYTSVSDDGAVNINMVGFQGEKSYYRNLIVGDGKGGKIIEVAGQDKSVSVTGELQLKGSESALVLYGNETYTNSALSSHIDWKDKNGVYMAGVGYFPSSSVFYITNNQGDVNIKGKSYVDILSPIKERGVLLTDKYASKTAFNTYRENAPTIEGGLQQFVTSTKPGATLCEEIGAATASSLKNYAKLSGKLSDMAVTEEDKALIRKNIGINDTGWVKVLDGLFIRRVGEVIIMQGGITVNAGKSLQFSLPANFPVPTYDVAFMWPDMFMTGKYIMGWIPSGERTCTVTSTDETEAVAGIGSVTYMP